MPALPNKSNQILRILFLLIVTLALSCEKNENTLSNPSITETNTLLFSYYISTGVSIEGHGMRCDLEANPYILTTILPNALCIRVNKASTEIVYHASKDGSIDIFRSSIAGSDIVNLTPDLSNQYIDSSPEWSPDGGQIVFTRYFKASSKEALMKMNRDGSGIRLLTDTSTLKVVAGGSWSPDGRSIALCAVPINGVTEMGLYTMDSSGANLYHCDSQTNGSIPLFSPDGSMIAYGKFAGLAVYMIELKMVIPLAISDKEALPYNFGWKPDGSLMFGAQNTATSKYDLYVASIGTTLTESVIVKASVLVTGLGENFSAVSSPDGQSVALLGIAANDSLLSLYSIDANGNNFKKVKTVDNDNSATAYPDNGMFWIN